MVKGYLTTKKGWYYVVYSYKDFGDTKRKTKWVSTKISESGNNKRKAQEFLESFMLKLNIEEEEKRKLKETSRANSRVLFSDYLLYWLETKRAVLESNSFSIYSKQVEGIILPFFKDSSVLLENVTHMDILSFYNINRQRGVSENTIYKYHTYLNQAFKLALKENLLLYNPMEKVTPPKRKKFYSDYYQIDELEKFFDVLKGDPLELFFLVVTYYGLRRSEALGLKWSSLSLNSETPMLSIRSVVVVDSSEGEGRHIKKKNYTKNQSSMRSLPLIPEIREKFLDERKNRLQLKKVLGSAYPKEDDDYVFVDSLGHLLNPDFVTDYFAKFIEAHELKKIRLHDLRHSCASLLISSENVEMHDVQIWLGHSNYSTTANIYAHASLPKSTKLSSEQLRNLLLTDRGKE